MASEAGRRRVRVSRKKQSVTEGDVKVVLDDLTKKMARIEAKMKAEQREFQLLHEKAFATMRAAKVDTHSCPHGDLKIKVSNGRSSTYISPKEYWAAVEEDAFFASVSVSVTKAKEHLSGKELNEIAEVTPGVKGPPTLKAEFYYPEEKDSDE